MCTHGSSLKDGAAHAASHSAWTRRQFLRGLAVVGGAGAVGLGGVPARAASHSGLLGALHAAGSDRILVLIQLAGGNDGLNTLVPTSNDLYHQARPNLRIRDADAIALTGEAGLHPSLADWAAPFQEGRLAIVQNVGYPDPDLSHFVSTDVWMSAEDPSDQSGTGWLGRYLDDAYPVEVAAALDRPVAVQIGASGPLLFQGPSRSMGVTFPSRSLLNRLTEGGSLYDEEGVPDTLLGEELSFVRRISNESFVYAQNITEAYDNGRNLVGYPGTSLGRNLATVARLIRGGLGSNVYHVSLGGFDTHANQAGGHSTLLRWLGQATRSFMNDLASDGQSERVLAMTFSEFGRRIRQNASNGTDHGTAAPLFLMGDGVAGGITGSMPDLANLDRNGNLQAQIDFRSVYASVLGDWFGVEDAGIAPLVGGAFPILPVLSGASVAAQSPGSLPDGYGLDPPYPNPAARRATLAVHLPEAQSLSVTLVDLLGRTVARPFSNVVMNAGSHYLPVDLPERLSAGRYLIRARAGGWTGTRALVVVR